MFFIQHETYKHQSSVTHIQIDINKLYSKQGGTYWFIYLFFFFLLLDIGGFSSLLPLVFLKLENYEPFNSVPFILNFELIYL